MKSLWWGLMAGSGSPNGRVTTSSKTAFFTVWMISLCYLVFICIGMRLECATTSASQQLVAVAGGDGGGRLGNGAPKDRHIVIVMPHIPSEIDRMVEAMAAWAELGHACSPTRTGQVGLVFYSSQAAPPSQSSWAEEATTSSIIETRLKEDSSFQEMVRTCFSEVRTVYAGLTPQEDGYPEGPSSMFFKMELDPRLEQDLKGYTHAYWMEWDTRPIRSLWVDAIVDASGGGDFWVRGSHYYGKELDDTLRSPGNENWVGHINSNALYKLGDPVFKDFLRVVCEREPPGDYWRPFDIFMWKVLNDKPYSWRTYQQYSSMFQQVGFIKHVGGQALDADEVRREYPQCFLLHGRDESSSSRVYLQKFKDGVPTTDRTVYGEEIRPNIKLSVLLRTYRDDMAMAALALKSARLHIPHALEYVAVVPDTDFDIANQTLPSFVKLIGEPHLIERGDVQQKYTKLMADTYTKGDYVMHLDSDVLFYRPVLYKDVFVMGKPILDFSSYEELKDTGVASWQQGMEYTLGHKVPYEFSRSNDHVYPRSVYKPARDYLENRFNTTVVEFLKTRVGKVPKKCTYETGCHRLFSDFNYLGAFMYWNMEEAVSWNYIGSNPDPSIKQFPLLHVIRPPMVCQGNARLTDEGSGFEDQRPIQMKLLEDIATGRTNHCWGLWGLVNELIAKAATLPS